MDGYEFTTWEEWIKLGWIKKDLVAPLMACGPQFPDCPVKRRDECVLTHCRLQHLRKMQLYPSDIDLQGCTGIGNTSIIEHWNRVYEKYYSSIRGGIVRNSINIQEFVIWASKFSHVPISRELLNSIKRTSLHKNDFLPPHGIPGKRRKENVGSLVASERRLSLWKEAYIPIMLRVAMQCQEEGPKGAGGHRRQRKDIEAMLRAHMPEDAEIPRTVIDCLFASLPDEHVDRKGGKTPAGE